MDWVGGGQSQEQGERHYQQLLGLHGVVSVNAQLLRRQRDGLFELRGQEHAHCAQELKMGLRSRDSGQEAVQIIHGQRKDFLFTLLFLTDLQPEWERVRDDSEKVASDTEEEKSINRGNQKKKKNFF